MKKDSWLQPLNKTNVKKRFIVATLIFIIFYGSLYLWYAGIIEPEKIIYKNNIPIELSSIEIVQQIAEDYHDTHTYSETDLFVCSDMATDVWNMIETRGINAQIVIGNLGNPDANIFECNHAWVLAEVDGGWVAVETTQGYLVYGSTTAGENIIRNDAYYRGFFFDNPRELKEFTDLQKEYNTKVKDVNSLAGQVNSCQSEYNSLVNTYNSNCAGTIIYSMLSYCTTLKNDVSLKLSEYNTLVGQYNSKMSEINSLIEEMNALV